jgi:NTE family protein
VQVTSAPIAELHAAQVGGTAAPEPAIDVDVPALLERISAVLTTVEDPIAARRQVGEMALARDRIPEAERRAIIAARLPVHAWPEKHVVVTTIQADTGAFRTLDRDSGVDVVDAVAASCAIPEVWPAVTIGDARHFDGGLRSGTNTDVAEGCSTVLVVRVLDLPETRDVQDISGSSAVHVVDPDADSEAAIGENPLDPAGIPDVAEAGFAQGVRIADDVRGFWR